MLFARFFFLILFLTGDIFITPAGKKYFSYTDNKNNNPVFPETENCREIVAITYNNLSCNIYQIRDLFAEGWDTLTQTKFWLKIIRMPEDTLLISSFPDRVILGSVSNNVWKNLSDTKKKVIKDSVLKASGLDTTTEIRVTGGKKFFYDFSKSIPLVDKGIYEFQLMKVDPWYAQAILLIESPNQLQKSPAGAYGPFQLMKKVARMYGLKVNSKTDERKNFERSACAAARLIKEICIPKARELMDELGFCAYDEKSLWFRLLVMHIYHAGYGNVRKAILKIPNPRSDFSLIRELWKTEAKGFKNASQNYSQLILATHVELYRLSGLAANPVF